MAGFDPAAATAAYLSEISPALKLAAERHAEAGVIAWALGWAGPLVLAALMLRSGLVERARRSGGGLAIILLLSVVSCAWELVARAVAVGGAPPLSLGGFCVDLLVRAVLLSAVWGLLRVMGRRPRLGLGVAVTAASFALVFGPVAVSELGGAATPAATGPLAAAALQLARASGVEASDVEVSPTAPGEGDVVGLLKPARVLLTPDAASQASLAEVRAGVGHVLGHYRARDGLGWASVLAVLGVLGVVFVVGLQGPVKRLLTPKPSGFRLREDERSRLADPRGLPVLWALTSIWLAVATPAAFAWDRTINLRADRFSLDHAREPDGLAKALIHENGLAPIDPKGLELWLTCSHPPLKDRIEQAMQWKAAQAQARYAKSS